jgi:hypothetical protein
MVRETPTLFSSKKGFAELKQPIALIDPVSLKFLYLSPRKGLCARTNASGPFPEFLIIHVTFLPPGRFVFRRSVSYVRCRLQAAVNCYIS